MRRVSIQIPLLVILGVLVACEDDAAETSADVSLPSAETRAEPDEPTRERATGEGPTHEEPAAPTHEEPPAEEPPAEEQTADDEPLAPYGSACRVPAIPIPRPRECERGATYPECKWQMPAAPLSDGRYRRWRNTIVEHWWGRPSLVTYILATTSEFDRLHPDQVVAVGDLDAPGPRHTTHDRGVDVDLYVLGALLTENAGGGRYPSNYEGKTEEDVEALRTRVLDLAKILATCANGAVRIYYNDLPVLERFHTWYDAQGFPENPFGRPMQRHNSLHDFHFHVTIPEDLPLHPMEPLPEGTEHPIVRIEAPPAPGTAAHLSSRTRRPGEWAAVPRE